jgi:hypothetical protein
MGIFEGLSNQTCQGNVNRYDLWLIGIDSYLVVLIANDCGQYSIPNNADAGTCSPSLAHGSTCSITCQNGYTLSGSSLLTCNAGSYSGSQTCQPQSCRGLSQRTITTTSIDLVCNGTDCANVTTTTSTLVPSSPIVVGNGTLGTCAATTIAAGRTCSFACNSG